MLINSALERAGRVGAFDFVGSSWWILHFKKRHNLVSRKVTGYESRAEADQRDDVEARSISYNLIVQSEDCFLID